MKAIHKAGLLVVLIFHLIPLLGQKPKVQVTFKINPKTYFGKTFRTNIPQLEQEGLIILKDGLNQYLPFIDFVTDSSPNTLDIKLEQTGDTSSVKDYILKIKFFGPGGQMDSVYKTYQTASQFNSLKKDVPSALNALKICWKDYLKANYNEVLVNKMFRKIPIEMNGDKYYTRSGNHYNLIIPFTVNNIKLFTNDSKFRVRVLGTDDLDDQEDRYYIGEVKSPGTMYGWIKIKLDEFDFTPQSGEVFFSKYFRDDTKTGNATDLSN